MYVYCTYYAPICRANGMEKASFARIVDAERRVLSRLHTEGRLKENDVHSITHLTFRDFLKFNDVLSWVNYFCLPRVQDLIEIRLKICYTIDFLNIISFGF